MNFAIAVSKATTFNLFSRERFWAKNVVFVPGTGLKFELNVQLVDEKPR